MNVTELQSKIFDLCGVKPTSKDEGHLRDRLAELRRRVPMNVSISQAAKHELEVIAEAKDTSTSDIVRIALREWAERNKQAQLVKLMGMMK